MSVFMWTIVFAISLLVVLLISDDYLLEDIIAFVVKKIIPKVKNLVKGRVYKDSSFFREIHKSYYGKEYRERIYNEGLRC